MSGLTIRGIFVQWNIIQPLQRIKCRNILQCRQTLKKLCYERSQMQKVTYRTFYLPEILRIGKTIETESRLVVFKGWRERVEESIGVLQERRKYSEIRIVNFKWLKWRILCYKTSIFFLRKKSQENTFYCSTKMQTLNIIMRKHKTHYFFSISKYS